MRPGLSSTRCARCYTATIVGELEPSASEVAEWMWADPRSLLAAVEATPWAFSPWLTLQFPALYADDSLEASDQL